MPNGVLHVEMEKRLGIMYDKTKKEKMMKFTYIIITQFVVVGCKTKVRNECVVKDSIVVTYYRGRYESFDTVSFVDMK